MLTAIDQLKDSSVDPESLYLRAILELDARLTAIEEKLTAINERDRSLGDVVGQSVFGKK